MFLKQHYDVLKQIPQSLLPNWKGASQPCCVPREKLNIHLGDEHCCFLGHSLDVCMFDGLLFPRKMGSD